MGKGYADGPAIEERMLEAELADRPKPARVRMAVLGSTAEDVERHFLGWLGEVDPDELFACGTAWGLSVVERPED